MDTIGKIVIHTNLRYQHQVDCAESLRAGFKVHSLPAEITPDRDMNGGIHVVLGPHYALERWRNHPHVLWLDRCFYGDTNKVSSIGWLDGAIRRFSKGRDRVLPDCKSWRSAGLKSLILADFGKDVSNIITEAVKYYHVKVRRHPADKEPDETLEQALETADIVIGQSGTSIVQALLAGVPGVCLDERHIAHPVTSHVIGNEIRPDRTDWLHTIAHAQFSHEEYRNGTAWDHLIRVF